MQMTHLKIAEPLSIAEMVVRSFVANCMITTLGAKSLTTHDSYSLLRPFYPQSHALLQADHLPNLICFRNLHIKIAAKKIV